MKNPKRKPITQKECIGLETIKTTIENGNQAEALKITSITKELRAAKPPTMASM